MFAILDGTGDYDVQAYLMNMARSFCVQIDQAIKQSPQDGPSYYSMGPGGLGLTTRGLVEDLFQKIVAFRKGQVRPDLLPPLYLAGYSRGGAGVMVLAKMLNDPSIDPVTDMLAKASKLKFPIPVEAMFLFDPVQRDASLPDADTISPNVKHVYVHFRDKSIEEVNTSDGLWPLLFPTVAAWKAATTNWAPDPGDIYARKWMGNADVTPVDPNRTSLQSPMVIAGASHGAVGGVPWVMRGPVEERAVKAAAEYMNQWFKKHSLNVKLRDLWFTEQSRREFRELEQKRKQQQEAEEQARRDQLIKNQEAGAYNNVGGREIIQRSPSGGITRRVEE